VRRRLALVLAAAGALVAAPAALGHVTVLPERPKLNSQQEFVVRVPNERDVPTVGLQVLFSTDLRVGQFAPKPGWQRKVLLTDSKRARGVRWTGGRIAPGEYADFRLLATPRTAGQAVFRVYQTYSDGKTKPWAGPPEKPGAAEQETGVEEPGPSPAVDVTATPDVPTGAAATALSTSTTTTKRTSSDAAIWLGLIAIVIALAAVLATGFLWSTRPATLPADEPGET
jgi:uncharacterized protein YcnI